MKKFILPILAVLTFSQSATSKATPVKDPSRILEQSDRFVGMTDFCQALQVQDTATMENRECNYSCTPDGCEEQCQVVDHSELAVMSCQRDGAMIASTSQGKTQFTHFSPALYNLHHGNMLRYILSESDAGLLAKLKVQKSDNSKDYLEINGVEMGKTQVGQHEVDSMTVHMTFHLWFEEQEDYGELPFQVTLGQNMPLIAQLLHLGFTPNSGTRLIDWNRK